MEINLNYELLSEFRKVTGWGDNEIYSKLADVKCNYVDVVKFYAAFGRLPNKGEEPLLNRLGANEAIRSLRLIENSKDYNLNFNNL